MLAIHTINCNFCNCLEHLQVKCEVILLVENLNLWRVLSGNQVQANTLVMVHSSGNLRLKYLFMAIASSGVASGDLRGKMLPTNTSQRRTVSDDRPHWSMGMITCPSQITFLEQNCHTSGWSYCSCRRLFFKKFLKL